VDSRDRLRVRTARICAIAAFGLFAANYTFAAEPDSAHRYELSGAGELKLDTPVQKSGTLSLKATLTGDHIAYRQPLQSGVRFALSASLAAASLVCYSDTIFRDDFDGDGF
jgi:hypothetical protein